MELSAILDWFDVVAGIALGAGWLWKLGGWFHAKVIYAREGAKLGEALVTELFSHATSPARRADIHAFIQFLCTEMEGEHTRSVMLSIVNACAVALMGGVLVVVDRFLNTDAAPWLWRFSLVAYVVTVISVAMFLFFSRQLRNVQIGWHNRAGDVLKERAFKHIPET